MKILIDEEYGYAFYVWETSYTRTEIQELWDSGKFPFGFWGPARDFDYRGSVTPLPLDTEEDYEELSFLKRTCNMACHVHEEDDSWIEERNVA